MLDFHFKLPDTRVQPLFLAGEVVPVVVLVGVCDDSVFKLGVEQVEVVRVHFEFLYKVVAHSHHFHAGVALEVEESEAQLHVAQVQLNLG